MTKKKMSIHYDKEGDYLEIRFGKATPSYFKDIGDDVFERRDESTDELRGYAIYNVQKRKCIQDIDVLLPTSS